MTTGIQIDDRAPEGGRGWVVRYRWIDGSVTYSTPILRWDATVRHYEAFRDACVVEHAIIERPSRRVVCQQEAAWIGAAA